MINITEAERQIIISLSWFRTRYALFLNLDLNRKANRSSIETFGEAWMGDFKCNWNNSFDTLVKKGILQFSAGTYEFTEKGNQFKNEVESQTPFFMYEYDSFFQNEHKSEAHTQFCEQVYGKDMSQHGLMDQNELAVLINILATLKPSNILDLGCGNGKITEHISGQLNPKQCLGVDISSEGIRLAQERTKNKETVEYRTGNLNQLAFNEQFDSILFLDTLYYAQDLKKTIYSCLDFLAEGGHIFAYFSQWIMEPAYSDNLKPENTHLGKALAEMGLAFTTTNLTESGLKHWKKKLTVLEKMKPNFIREGNKDLWEYRYREAQRYAHWGDDKYARYLYEISR